MVLTDERWAALAPLLEACRPEGKTPPRDLRRTVEAIVWRHANGAKWRAGPGAPGAGGGGAPPFVPLGRLAGWGRGGGPPSSSSAGPGSGSGSGCWKRRRRAGSSSAWRSSTAPASGRTPRPRVRPKRGTSRQRDRREALGRSRGGSGTKACVIADGRGRAVAFALAPGQAHELPLAPGLLGRLPRVPLWVVGDRGYSADAFRELIWSSGARPAIPTRSNEAAVACPDFIYNNRNLVERLWGRLKEWRAVATRYEKTAASYLGVLCLAATADWLKP